MKVEKVKALRDTLIDKTGIDFEVYRNDELSERLIGLIEFPIYFAITIAKPLIGYLLITFGLAVILYWFGDSVFMVILLLIIGIILSLFDGVFQGLANFLKKLKEDISRILSLSLEIVRSVLGDVQHTSSKQIKEIPKISEIISGVILIVIVPTLNNIIKEKIPLLGGVLVGLVDYVLDKMTSMMSDVADSLSKAISNSNTVKAIENKQDKIGNAADGKISKYCEASLGVVDRVQNTSDKIIEGVFSKVTLPFSIILKTGYVITFIIYFVICRAAL